jgi:hypothetical protein
VVDGEVKPQSGHAKDYKIDICYFSPQEANHEFLMDGLKENNFLYF